MRQRLKKINAVLGLLTIMLLIAHAVYYAFSYITMYYNPAAKIILAAPLITAACLHAVLGMSLVFVQSDGTDLTLYPQYNKGTILQRLSAALIFPLLMLHVNTFRIMKASSEAGRHAPVIIMIVIELLFFAVVFTHVSLSFSRALVTLGLLSSEDRKRAIDRTVYVICAVLFVFCLIAVARTQLIMFMK